MKKCVGVQLWPWVWLVCSSEISFQTQDAAILACNDSLLLCQPQLPQWIGESLQARLHAYWAGCAAISSQNDWYHWRTVLLQRAALQVSRVWAQRRLNPEEAKPSWRLLYGEQDVWCGRPEVREKEVDPLLRGRYLHHLLWSSQCIWHGPGRGRWSGELGQPEEYERRLSSVSNARHCFWTFSESHARVPPSIQQYLQPQVLCTDLHRAFPQQEGSFRREDQEGPSEYLLPRLWR